MLLRPRFMFTSVMTFLPDVRGGVASVRIGNRLPAGPTQAPRGKALAQRGSCGGMSPAVFRSDPTA